MYKKKIIAVVVPAFNEEELIETTISGIPLFIDKIVTVNDCSKDSTKKIIENISKKNNKLVVINHDSNQGVGGAIRSGYIWCRKNNIDVAVVMAGDNQMNPDDLPALLEPVVADKVDYAKGNRLISGDAWKKIPKVRYIGISFLSFFTKIASGYWHIADSQSGYTAINKKALSLIPLEKIYCDYGIPNDLLVTLNIFNLRVCDVQVEPVYANEKSGIKIRKVIFTISFLLLRLFTKRLIQKYIIREFHPLVLFYFLGFFCFSLNIPLGILFITRWISIGSVPDITFLSMIFSTIAGLHLIFFAMLFDMKSNKHLRQSD